MFPCPSEVLDQGFGDLPSIYALSELGIPVTKPSTPES